MENPCSLKGAKIELVASIHLSKFNVPGHHFPILIRFDLFSIFPSRHRQAGSFELRYGGVLSAASYYKIHTHLRYSETLTQPSPRAFAPLYHPPAAARFRHPPSRSIPRLLQFRFPGESTPFDLMNLKFSFF